MFHFYYSESGGCPVVLALAQFNRIPRQSHSAGIILLHRCILAIRLDFQAHNISPKFHVLLNMSRWYLVSKAGIPQMASSASPSSHERTFRWLSTVVARFPHYESLPYQGWAIAQARQTGVRRTLLFDASIEVEMQTVGLYSTINKGNRALLLYWRFLAYSSFIVTYPYCYSIFSASPYLFSHNMHHLPTDKLFSLQGKTVICTGATGGIGQTLCKSLAIAGADIVSIQISNDVHSESLSRSILEIGQKLWTFECNLTDPSSIRSTFQRIWLAGIRPSILLNCAGVNRRGPITEVTDDDLDLVWTMSGPYSLIWQALTITSDSIRQSQGYLCNRTRICKQIASASASWENHQHWFGNFISGHVQCFCLCKLQGRSHTNDKVFQQWTCPSQHSSQLHLPRVISWFFCNPLVGAFRIKAKFGIDISVRLWRHS